MVTTLCEFSGDGLDPILHTVCLKRKGTERSTLTIMRSARSPGLTSRWRPSAVGVIQPEHSWLVSFELRRRLGAPVLRITTAVANGVLPICVFGVFSVGRVAPRCLILISIHVALTPLSMIQPAQQAWHSSNNKMLTLLWLFLNSCCSVGAECLCQYRLPVPPLRPRLAHPMTNCRVAHWTKKCAEVLRVLLSAPALCTPTVAQLL